MNMGYQVIRPKWEKVWGKGRYIALYTFIPPINVGKVKSRGF